MEGWMDDIWIDDDTWMDGWMDFLNSYLIFSALTFLTFSSFFSYFYIIVKNVYMYNKSESKC